MPVQNRIADFHDDMTAWRRDLHAHPELGFAEHRTSGVIQAKLAEFGVDEIITGLAGTGVVGVIRGGASDRAIGLRADIDALPIHEATGAAWASRTPGVMHACGHDGHTAMLLGAARYLAETRRFDGTVYVIFQPAEEGGGGGDVMVREGLFEKCPADLVFGLHNWPSAPEGVFQWRVGPTMAATAVIDITIRGRGAHAARPHDGVDPIVISAAIIQALQSVVARSLDPLEAGVVSITWVEGGSATNVIPETVRLRGTARWFEPAVGDLLERRVTELATGIAAGFGAVAEIDYRRGYPAVVNDPDATELARRAAETVAGSARVAHMDKPTMGGEDFSYMLLQRPGAYLMLGAGRTDADPGVHHPRYDFNDAILPVGASWWATLAEQLLPRTTA